MIWSDERGGSAGRLLEPAEAWRASSELLSSVNAVVIRLLSAVLPGLDRALQRRGAKRLLTMGRGAKDKGEPQYGYSQETQVPYATAMGAARNWRL